MHLNCANCDAMPQMVVLKRNLHYRMIDKMDKSAYMKGVCCVAGRYEHNIHVELCGFFWDAFANAVRTIAN